jgi:hypothetical protein
MMQVQVTHYRVRQKILLLYHRGQRGAGSIVSKLEYVVLFHVYTLSGLYLDEPINMEKSFQPSQ